MIPLIVICGPTAIGKSEAGFILAQRWNSEIISADSRQIYKFMDIGTAKPHKRERNCIKHHLIDVIEPDKIYNAGQFQKDSQPIIETLQNHGVVPIIIGGTGLYIKAAVYGLFSGPPSNPEIKTNLQKDITEKGIEYLFQKLKTVDSQTAKRLHPNDKQRIIRALEVYYTTGHTISSLQEKHNAEKPLRPTVIVVLNRSREDLYQRIEQRVDAMLKQGFIDEVKNILEMGYKKDDPGMQSLGYSIMTEYLENKITLPTAISLIKRDTRHYAKRQMTWFRQEKKAHWLEISPDMTSLQLAETIEKTIWRSLLTMK